MNDEVTYGPEQLDAAGLRFRTRTAETGEAFFGMHGVGDAYDEVAFLDLTAANHDFPYEGIYPIPPQDRNSYPTHLSELYGAEHSPLLSKADQALISGLHLASRKRKWQYEEIDRTKRFGYESLFKACLGKTLGGIVVRHEDIAEAAAAVVEVFGQDVPQSLIAPRVVEAEVDDTQLPKWMQKRNANIDASGDPERQAWKLHYVEAVSKPTFEPTPSLFSEAELADRYANDLPKGEEIIELPRAYTHGTHNLGPYKYNSNIVSKEYPPTSSSLLPYPINNNRLSKYPQKFIIPSSGSFVKQ